jgi:hypothetical protein
MVSSNLETLLAQMKPDMRGTETFSHFRTSSMQMMVKGKAVPLQTMEAQEGEELYSSCSFMTSTLKGMSGQSHGPTALYPPGKGPPAHIGQESGWALEPVWTQTLKEKSSCLCRGSNLDRPVIQSVVRHYTV